MDNPNVELIEERIGSKTDKSKVICYCLGSWTKLPYPNYLNPVILFSLLILSFVIASFFAYLALIWLVIAILLLVRYYKKYILVFLDDKLTVMNVKGSDFNILNTNTYRYLDITDTKMGKKSGVITFNDDFKVTIYPPPDNSSFKPEDFDFEEFIDKQIEKQKVKK